MKLRLFRDLLIVAGFTATLGAPASAEPILHHVHGLAFTPDGGALVVPAHIGLAVYRDGRWSSAPGPAHDFMGFSVAKNAIYTSGHPAPGSPLRNPLGLIKSTDGGKTWQQLSLYGEADFHDIAVGYQTNVVYVISGWANSQMPQPGIYYTRDEGKTWKRSELGGISSPINSIAAHPGDAATVALGTMSGPYLSRDFGQRFRRVGPGKAVTAVFFELDGKHLLFASEDASALVRVALDGGSNQNLKLPALASDFVAYIARSPADRKELAIATRKRHVFISKDAGKTWKQIAKNGEGL
jgi:hypothetical protein